MSQKIENLSPEVFLKSNLFYFFSSFFFESSLLLPVPLNLLLVPTNVLCWRSLCMPQTPTEHIKSLFFFTAEYLIARQIEFYSSSYRKLLKVSSFQNKIHFVLHQGSCGLNVHGGLSFKLEIMQGWKVGKKREGKSHLRHVRLFATSLWFQQCYCLKINIFQI